MTTDKIIEVCNRYQDRLRDLSSLTDNARLHHLFNRMIPLTIQFASDNRLEKAFRWLGFMQGVLWAEGVYAIDELKNHNKPTEPS